MPNVYHGEAYRRRRITPKTMVSYWPTKRVAILRRYWPTYTPTPVLLDKLNAVPAPRLLTAWHCWLMAAFLRIKRPPHWVAWHKSVSGNRLGAVGAAWLAKRMRRLDKIIPPVPDARKNAVAPFFKPLKTGSRKRAKPQPRPWLPRGWTPGLQARTPKRKRSTKKTPAPTVSDTQGIPTSHPA